MGTINKMANRFGLHTKIYDYKGYTKESSNPVLDIDFANISEISLSGESTWATGGQAHGNKIGFNNPLEGTFKISTQIMTNELLALMAGQDIENEMTEIVFKNDTGSTTPNYYVITSNTVWQGEDGTVYDENLTFHKVFAKRALNITYDGSGDPVSCDVEFELAQDDEGKVLTINRDKK